jgi:NADPH:quinone reductase-like Zn-dependent oxidoreductase
VEKSARSGTGDASGSALWTVRKSAFPSSAITAGARNTAPTRKGCDVGVIDMVGEGVNPDRIGERVWVWNGQRQRPIGTAAQYVVQPELQAVELPAAVEFAAAACLGIPATSTFRRFIC